MDHVSSRMDRHMYVMLALTNQIITGSRHREEEQEDLQHTTNQMYAHYKPAVYAKLQWVECKNELLFQQQCVSFRIYLGNRTNISCSSWSNDRLMFVSTYKSNFHKEQAQKKESAQDR